MKTFKQWIEFYIGFNWSVKSIKGQFINANGLCVNSFVAADYFQKQFNADNCIAIQNALLSLAD